jgi:autotransporter family porin
VGNGGASGSITGDVTNNGALVFNRSDVYQYGGRVSGSGRLVQAGAGTLALAGLNTYSGGTAVQAGTLQLGAASTQSSSNLGSGAVDIAAGATLLANTNAAFNFDNALTGAGTLRASSTGAPAAFDFGATAAVGTAFAGQVELRNNRFTLADDGVHDNTAALTKATLVVGAGNVTTVGSGNQTIGGLAFDGGAVAFDVTAPAQTQATSFITTATLDVSGAGFVRIQVPDPYALPAPTPADNASLFAQSHVVDGLQLVAGSVAGNASGLKLQDWSGAAITNSRDVKIDQGGGTVAIGQYDYTLDTGNNDGLYVGYALKTIDLQAGKTLTRTENAGASGNDIDMAADITGAGDLDIAARDAIVLSGSNSFTGATAISSGILRAGAENVIGDSQAVTLMKNTVFDTGGHDQAVNNLNGDASSQIRLSNNTLTVHSTPAGNSYDGVISGTGGLTLAAGTQTLGGLNTYSGATRVDAGTLRAGIANAFSAGSGVTVGANATLDANGLSQTVKSLTIEKDGIVRITHGADTASNAVFTVAGDYESRDGILVMGTQWGDDGSIHDELTVTGKASGDTRLRILTRGGATGAQTDVGIKVVNLNPASVNTATFSIDPGSVGYRRGSDGIFAVGPFNWEYTLKPGGNGGAAEDIYLLVEPAGGDDDVVPDNYRPEVGSYLDNRRTAMQSLWHTLHDRQTQAPGMIGDASGQPDANRWARVQGNFNRHDSGQFKSEDDHYLLHAGSDLMRWNTGDGGSLRLGLMGMVNRGSGATSSPGQGRSRQSVEGLSAGLYATWYGAADPATGPYLDGWLMGGSFRNTVRGAGLAEENYRASVYTASLEAGYGITVHQNKDTRVIVQPQAQVLVSNYRAGNHTEDGGTVVSNLNDSQTTTRLGVRMYADIHQGASRLRPYAEINWWHGSSAQTMRFDGIAVRDRLPANLGELKLGIEGNATPNLTLWGGLGMQRGGGYRSTTVNAGLKYSW